jgi:hypothetical protein
VFYLFNIIIFDNKSDKRIAWFQSFIRDVCGSKSDPRIINRLPGGASLYSLSVAWVSSCEALALKRGFAS